MSKSRTGANISAEDIMASNPDLLGQVGQALGQVGQAPPQSTAEPMQESAPAPMSTEQAISNFYGSGDRITQPDIGYYDQFLLPGDTGRAPVPAQEGPATSPPPASSPTPGGSGLTNAGYPASMPPDVVEAITRLNTGGIGGRKNMLERRRAQEVINNFMADPSSAAPAAPVNLAGMNLSTSMPAPASQPPATTSSAGGGLFTRPATTSSAGGGLFTRPATTSSAGGGLFTRPAVMPSRGPMVPIFDFEDLERRGLFRR